MGTAGPRPGSPALAASCELPGFLRSRRVRPIPSSPVSDPARAAAKVPMRVLVVDDDVNVRFPLERALRKAGMETGSATSVRHAIDRLRSEPFDAVITDVRIAGADGTQILQWIGSYTPSTKAFIASSVLTPEMRELYGASGDIRIFDKPIDTEAVIAALEESGPRRGFYGNAVELEFFDYVQMIALSGRDKLVEVHTPKGRGLIWFEHGDIVHCEYDQYRGETAFYMLLAVNRGTFRELFNRRAPLHTVTRSSTHLLMEAARQADEGTLGMIGAGKGEGTAVPHELAPEPTPQPAAVIEEVVPADEVSFEDLNDLSDLGDVIDLEDPFANDPGPPVVPSVPAEEPAVPQVVGRVGLDESTHPIAKLRSATSKPEPVPFGESSMVGSDDSAALSTAAGHAIFDDPDTRSGMLDQFWQFEGINGVAIISSTGKVLAEDMRTNSSLVTLAGFYMRGAARIARTLGFNVFDGVVARSVNGQQMVMVSMGAASAVLSVAPGADPEAVRDAVMGVE
ncbi:MAG: response regulator [Deltaproteobacteria bacterium]|nr:response regulator [Deltaproteobacteria bacterium]